MSLRRGMFEIGNDDARRIAEAMHADIGQSGWLQFILAL